MTRAVHIGGTVAAYVWDYADQMQLICYFWIAAVALDKTSLPLDEGRVLFYLSPQAFRKLIQASTHLENVDIRAIDIPTVFSDFDDYWSPFLGGQGPAPSYTMSLSEERRDALREYLRLTLPIASYGSIHLIARAWAVRGVRRN
jgi:hypothetical protein